MKNNALLKTKIPQKILVIGIGLGMLSWAADAALDSLYLREESFFQALVNPSARELAIRFVVMLIIFGFGVYAGLVIERLRQSEERMHESEERYRSVVETARDVIYSLSRDGLLTSINPAFERLTGWQAPEMLGQSFLTLVHPDDASASMQIFQSVLSGRVPDVFELRIRVRSGEYLTGEFTVTPQVRHDRVTGVLGIARDVSGRKRTEMALAEKEAKYRDLFENANDLIQSVAADGTFQYVNRAWRETLGYTDEDIARLTLFDIVHPDFREHCMAVFGRLLAGEKIDNVEAVFLTKGGRPVIVEGNINCSIVDGAPVATRGIFRDITEHRHATELIKNILESVDEGFTVINRDFRILSANKAYADKFKLQIPEIIGKHCYEISHHLTKPCYEAGEDCAVRHTFDHGAPHTAIHVHYDKDGNPVYIETKAYPLRDSLGRVVSAIEIHNDITDKKKLEDQLRHAQKMEAVGALAGGIAHDFNNILTAIIGYGTLLQMKMDGADPHRSYVDHILTSTERAANLTQSLLAFSRKQSINLQPISLNTLVNRVEKLITRLIGEDIDVRILLCDGATTIHADAGQMEQVLMNLVTNARDAMPRGGLLTIQTGVFDLDNDFIRTHGYGSVGRYIQLTVTDTGIGMDDRTRERIFEPFFTTKEVGRGTGLGLAIVYGIVKQHGGYINVYSESGEGTTFSLYLPLIAATVEAARPAEAPMPQGGNATILVAEDDDSVRALTRAVLEGFGYTVIEAVDGEDALVKFSAHQDRIQLLLLDIIMPKKNGRTVYEEIEAMHPGVKALFTSGYTAEAMREKGIIEDAFNFIAKPVSPRDLLKKVKEVLDAEPAKTCKHAV
jgi:PAS domain S-box-containing protein